MTDIPWDQAATLIDLDGKTPVIGSMLDCVTHFSLFKPVAKEQARILLTQPVFREGRQTRTWILDPDEIGKLAEQLAADRSADQ